MIKLIIVDDEEMERYGLKKNINWNELGIEVVGLYENGKLAYEAILRNMPDIILTDIRMPVMDGLELAEKVREINDRVKVMFISGYEDFQYAKKALDIKASNYILKPYKISELISAIKEVVQECEGEKRDAEKKQIMMKRLEESLPLLKDKFCIDLLFGIYRDENWINNRAEFLDMSAHLDGVHYVCVVDLENYYSFIENKDEVYKNMLSILVVDKIKDILKNQKCMCANIDDWSVGIILSFDNGIDSKKVYQIMDNLHMELTNYIHSTVSIGISDPCGSLINLKVAYKQAMEALRRRFVLGQNQIIQYSDIAGIDTWKLDGIIEREKSEIETLISNGDVNSIVKHVDMIFDAFCDYKADNRYIQNTCIGIVNDIIKLLLKMDINIEDIFGKNVNLIAKLLNFETIIDINQWMKNIIAGIAEHIRNKNNSRNQRIIERIKEVVVRRYAEDLSVADVASEVFLSAGYATSLFKKETGQSIMDYIIQTRIKIAKEMLKEPSVRISEVSNKVGYENVAYFSSLFKNIVGVSPKEYRDRMSA